MNYSMIIEKFLAFIKDCKVRNKFYLEQAEELNKRQEDLLHDIEFADSDNIINELAKELHEIRLSRRAAKDEVELTEPVAAFLEKHKAIINALEQLLGTVRRIEKYHETRTYRYRAEKKEVENEIL